MGRTLDFLTEDSKLAIVTGVRVSATPEDSPASRKAAALIDTGASYCVITHALAKDAGILKGGRTRSPLQGALASTSDWLYEARIRVGDFSLACPVFVNLNPGVRWKVLLGTAVLHYGRLLYNEPAGKYTLDLPRGDFRLGAE